MATATKLQGDSFMWAHMKVSLQQKFVVIFKNTLKPLASS